MNPAQLNHFSMPENSSFIFDSSSRIQNLHKFFVSNQQKSLGIIVFTFILISSLEFILLLLDLLKNETNQWFRLTKIAIDLTNSIILGFLAKTFPTKIYKAKNYLAYVCLWVFILNEIGFGYAEAFDTENFHAAIKTFFTLLVIKVLVLQMMCLLLSIGKIFQLIPLILMGILSLGFIAHNITSLKLFIESSICFTAFVFMVLMMTLRKEYLYKMISSSIEEVTFCKDIIKTIPIGVLLVDREYKIIYQNNQMANYFDTLPPDIRSPQNLFRQFKGAEIPEESLATLFKDAINQKFEVHYIFFLL